MKKYVLILKQWKIFWEVDTNVLNIDFFLDENIILIPIISNYCQFGQYILIAVNLVTITFNLQSTYSQFLLVSWWYRSNWLQVKNNNNEIIKI